MACASFCVSVLRCKIFMGNGGVLTFRLLYEVNIKHSPLKKSLLQRSRQKAVLPEPSIEGIPDDLTILADTCQTSKITLSEFLGIPKDSSA